MPRDTVVAFADKMESVLKKNDYKGGWQNCDARFFLKKLAEEVFELSEILRKIQYGQPLNSFDDLASEAADVANIAMMVWDNYGEKETPNAAA